MSKLTKIREGNEFINKLTNQTDKQISYYKIEYNNKTYTLSRSEAELIYRFYSTSKYTIPVAEICHRFFPYYSLGELKNIIKTFSEHANLSYNTTSFTPHEYEELNNEERSDKISNFILHKEIIKSQGDELGTLKNLVKKQQNIIKKYKEIENVIRNTNLINKSDVYLAKDYSQVSSSKALAIYISDMHIGCFVPESQAPLNLNIGYDYNEVIDRINKFIDYIKTLNTKFEEVWVFNLGDAIDGIDGTTTRRDVKLPQNQGNTEMINSYIKAIIYLFDNLNFNLKAKRYFFRSVGESNHGGTAEYAASLAISFYLKSKGVDSYVAEGPYGICKIFNHIIVYFHGKDNLNQNSPLPNVLDNKTVVYLDSFLSRNGLSDYKGPILFIKGDSHKPSLTSTEVYDYKTVSSLFGSSSWGQANFPAIKWGIDFSIFSNDARLDGSVKDVVDKQTPNII